MAKNPEELVTESIQPSQQAVLADSFLSLPNATQHVTMHKRDFRFWIVFLCITASQYITALESSAISTALPTIVDALHGEQFVWIGSGYMISTTAFVPLSGNFAQIFGRRLTMLASLLVFALGSALCGAAKSMNFLIAARVVQGVGSGGIQAMCQIIISDVIPLKDRGMFNGFLAIAYVIANGTGPVIGGALAQYGHWRWVFYLNLPICGLTAVLAVMFLRVRTPPGTITEKLARVDWIGNIIVIAATTSAMVSLTWGGVQYSWASWHILVPLILGFSGLVGFMVYEHFIPRDPIVPFAVLSTRTSTGGYLQVLTNYTVMAGTLYYLPVYFQACKGAGPVASGVDLFGMAFTIAPSALIAGISITKSGRYRPQMWFAWVLSIVSLGTLSTVYADTPRSRVIGFEVLHGAGTGILAASISFPILAPLAVEHHPHALAVYMFLRNFSYILGITIGGTVLQNELKRQLPPGFTQQFPGSTAIAYSIIPLVNTLEEPLKGEVQAAFAGSVRVIWQVLLGVACLGFVCSLLMQAIPLHSHTDEKWGLEDQQNASDQNDSHELEAQEPRQEPKEVDSTSQLDLSSR